MVADYSMWQPDSLEPLWRAWLIRRWVAAYERMQARVLRRALVLPISSAYTRRLERRFPNVQTIFTSSLRAADVMSESEAAGWRWDPAAGRDRPATLIYTGRLVEEKGILDAIVAVAELKRRGWLVQLVLVGWWPDPDFESVVRKRAADYGVADSIRSEGYVPSGEALMKIYRSADIYIHPTRNEGGVARSLKEAMAAHIPTVTTKIMVMDEELQDGGQTMLVEPSSPSALAAAIERLLADGDLAARVAAGGWQWARKRTNEESCALILDLVTGWVREKTRP
jgi:glycosyltransferase involved in cell wall biosynthesis